jgi:hypothetical protein
VSGKQGRLTVVPIKQDEAKSFVRQVHRHHPAPPGSVFQLAVADELGAIRGVAMVGRPVSIGWDDEWTLEINRTATDGCENANSALYGAAWRAAKALGWLRLFTYTLKSESGSSLRAAGYRLVGERKGRSWADSSKARPRVDTYAETGQAKLVWAGHPEENERAEPELVATEISGGGLRPDDR